VEIGVPPEGEAAAVDNKYQGKHDNRGKVIRLVKEYEEQPFKGEYDSLEGEGEGVRDIDTLSFFLFDHLIFGKVQIGLYLLHILILFFGIFFQAPADYGFIPFSAGVFLFFRFLSGKHLMKQRSQRIEYAGERGSFLFVIRHKIKKFHPSGGGHKNIAGL